MHNFNKKLQILQKNVKKIKYKENLYMFELISGLKILHNYTENVFISEEFICVDVEGLQISELHERYLASYDWKLDGTWYKFEMEEV